jgi:hypothetical protein
MRKILIYSLICGLFSILPFYFAFMIMNIPDRHINRFGFYLITVIITGSQYFVYKKTKKILYNTKLGLAKATLLILTPLFCCFIGYEIINSIYLIRFLIKENIEIIPMTFFSGLIDNGFNRRFIGFGVIIPIVISGISYLIINLKKIKTTANKVYKP